MRELVKSKTSMKVVAIALTCSLAVSAFAVPAPLAAQAAENDAIVFKTQSGGVFDGMPLFDGVPEHLDKFVDTYFEYTGLEGPAVYVTGSRNHYTLKEGANAGKKSPEHFLQLIMYKAYLPIFLHLLDWDRRGTRSFSQK